MAKDLAQFAEDNSVKYFMISFTDLFGGQRAKLVPARAIADMQEDGAGFAGFATWLDLTPGTSGHVGGAGSKGRRHLAMEQRNCLGSQPIASWKAKTSPKPHATYCAS